MPRVNPFQEALNAGEFSPRMASRIGFEKYPNACALLKNMIPLLQGGAARRPGSRFVGAAKDSAARGRLIPFEFSTEQAYVFEAGDRYLRFYRNQGQIAVPNTIGAINNGAFDTNVSGWSDLSTGGNAAIAREVLGQAEEGTFDGANNNAFQFGDGVADRANMGQRFPNSLAGTVTRVRVPVSAVTVAFNAVASIWTDDAGSPGEQVGGDSVAVNLDAVGVFSFTWGSSAPALEDDTTYWVVISDQDAGTGNVTIRTTAGLGAAFGLGANDTIASIADAFGREARVGVTVNTATTNGALALIGDTDQTAVAEQEVVITPGVEHVLRFRVIGVPGDSVKLRVGTASGSVDLVNDFPYLPGYHAVSFTPEVSPIFVQFRHERAKTVYVDDVDLLDDQPFELATPYTTDDLPFLKWAQSADLMYLAHPDFPIHRLSRTGDTSWSLEEVAWDDGPYQDDNADPDVLLQPSAINGLGITITAEGAAPFAVTDVGRLVRLKTTDTGDFGYAVITAFEAGDSVQADVISDFANTAQTVNWALGAWSETTGYPSTVTFFEQRFVAAATRLQRQTFWMSQSADIENMRPDTFESNVIEIQDDDALVFTLAATKVNAIRWLASGEQMYIGTVGGEWVVTSDGAVVSPNDIQVDQPTTHGSADISAVRVGFETLFVQRARRKLRAISFDFNVDTFRAPDMTILADHISQTKFREMQYQEEPDALLWCVREDGQVGTLTFLREQNVVGWSRQVMGGSFNGGDAVVESVAIIPGSVLTASEERDEVWALVKRTINGQTVRYVEFFEEGFEGPRREDFDTDADFDAATVEAQREAFYVDSGLSGDFETPRTEVSGLDHLEGETVAVLADGAVVSDQVVSGGAITLDAPASKIVAGLPYEHRYKSLKLAVGARAGTAIGKTKRIGAVTLVLLTSLKGEHSPDGVNWDPIVFREVEDKMDTAVPLFTGEKEVSFDGRHETDPRIHIRGSAPVPFNLLALAPEMVTRDVV